MSRSLTMDDMFMGYGEDPPWNEAGFMLSLLSANERMGAALDFIYRECPEMRLRVAQHLADYPFTFSESE